MTNVPYLQGDEVAPRGLLSMLRLRGERVLAPGSPMEPDAQHPDVLELERCFLPDGFTLVSRLARSGVTCRPMMIAH